MRSGEGWVRKEGCGLEGKNCNSSVRGEVQEGVSYKERAGGSGGWGGLQKDVEGCVCVWHKRT